MKYDLLVIGAGPGGYPGAIEAAKLGLKVAIVEKSPHLGGTCLNVGCIPSKTLLHFTELFEATKKSPFSAIKLDFKALQQYREQVIEQLRAILKNYFKQLKIDVIEGSAQLLSASQVQVGAQIIEATKILLATGSESISLPFLPVDEQTVLTSTGALQLEKPPQSLTVVGGGVIGVELASVFQRLGTKVDIVEMLPDVCTGLDIDLSKALQRSLEKEGLQLHLSTRLISAEKSATGRQLSLKNSTKEYSIESEKVLVAIGRRPFTKNLGLEKAGIQLLPSGHIAVNSRLETSAPNIFAVGDLIEGPMLAHRAEAESRSVGLYVGGQDFEKVDYFALPSVIYTFPEVSSVGLAEEEMKKFERPYKATKAYFKGNPRAMASGVNEGFVKVISDAHTGIIVGMHIIGPTSSELIAIGMLAISKRVTIQELHRMPFAHPTLSEAVRDASV